MIFFFSENFFCENCFLRMSFGSTVELENIRKSFWKLKEGEKGKNFDKKVNSLTRYKIGDTGVVESSWLVPFFLFTFFCLANPIPSSDRPSASLRSNNCPYENQCVFVRRGGRGGGGTIILQLQVEPKLLWKDSWKRTFFFSFCLVGIWKLNLAHSKKNGVWGWGVGGGGWKWSCLVVKY